VGAISPEVLNALVRPSRPAVTTEEPLRAELRSFEEAVRRRSRPLVPLEEGRRALAVALEILDAIRRHGEQIHLERLWTTPAR
jgi:hypothetical protein